MVQRTSVRGINRYGRGSQGVRVMNLKEDDKVSAIALVAESSADLDAPDPILAGSDPDAGPPEDLAAPDLPPAEEP
jgi:DNA gyrase subunit A